MYYIAKCLNTEFCSWCQVIENYAEFDYQCPDCYSVAIITDQKDNINQEQNIGLLLSPTFRKIKDTQDSME